MDLIKQVEDKVKAWEDNNNPYITCETKEIRQLVDEVKALQSEISEDEDEISSLRLQLREQTEHVNRLTEIAERYKGALEEIANLREQLVNTNEWELSIAFGKAEDIAEEALKENE